MTDYEQAESMNLTSIDRWSAGMEHHAMSVRLMEFLSKHDFNDYDDYFDWNVGGDGDNGEILLFQLDTFFEMRDQLEALEVPV